MRNARAPKHPLPERSRWHGKDWFCASPAVNIQRMRARSVQVTCRGEGRGPDRRQGQSRREVGVESGREHPPTRRALVRGMKAPRQSYAFSLEHSVMCTQHLRGDLLRLLILPVQRLCFWEISHHGLDAALPVGLPSHISVCPSFLDNVRISPANPNRSIPLTASFTPASGPLACTPTKPSHSKRTDPARLPQAVSRS